MSPPSGNRRPSPGVKPLKSSNPSTKSKLQTKTPKPNSSKTLPYTQARDGPGPAPTTLPLELQQLILNVFSDNFSSRFDENVQSLLQEVKKCLYNRDFANAFGKEEYLEAYAMRWSPSRALAYLDVLCGLDDLWIRLAERPRESREDEKPPDPALTLVQGTARILCLGGGAGAEVAALAGYLDYLNSQQSGRGRSPPVKGKASICFKITAVDIADWSSIMRKLYSSIITPPDLSEYASATARSSNAPLADPSIYEAKFERHDLLNMEVDQIASMLQDITLVTLMFTLNELYSTSLSATTNLLLSITVLLSPGSLLLVVDSPGSYSTVSIGKAGDEKVEKKYPMHWLLDHTLLESAAIGSSKNSMQEKQWEKVDSHDSRWFRLPEALKYPLNLEDMRYQVHLYRRI